MRKRKQYVLNRVNLSDDEFFLQFYSDSELPKAKIIKVWHDIALILDVDPGKLRPSDKLTELDGYNKYNQPNISSMELYIIDNSFCNSEKNLDTIDSIVRFLSGNN